MKIEYSLTLDLPSIDDYPADQMLKLNRAIRRQVEALIHPAHPTAKVYLSNLSHIIDPDRPAS